MTPADPPVVTRFVAELATGIAVLVLGLIVVYGAMQLDTGWGDGGPQAGYFPFYVGCIICVAACIILIHKAMTKPPVDEVILSRSQLARVSAFFLPIVAYVVGALFLGLYVASAIYLSCVMKLQGGYGSLRSILAGIATSCIFFLMFEIWFGIPLLKGPLEAALGIY